MEFSTKAIKTATTTVISADKRQVFIHTVVCPKALGGTATFQDKDGTEYFVLPIASIGALILDANFPNGLSVVTSSGDTVLVTTSIR